jgi:hypothetical protein
MKLTQSAKTFIGIGTIWLLVYPVLFILAFFVTIPFGFMSEGMGDFFPFSIFSFIFPLHCLTFVLQIGLLIFYLAHIIKNTAASEVLRIILGVGIFFMPYLAMPFYYYLYIWREIPPEWALDNKTQQKPVTSFDPQPAIAATPKQQPISRKSIIIILSVIAILVILFVTAVALLFSQFSNIMSNPGRPFMGESFDFPPESVPARIITETEGVATLWVKEMDLENPHKVYVEFFIPNEQSVVFWSPNTASLMSLNMVTGETIWQTAVPDVSVMRLVGDKFFVVSSDWVRTLPAAPIPYDQTFPDCSWAGNASVLAFDPDTGEQIWGYAYEGVDSYDISFEDQFIYMSGSNDHGASRSMAQIDAKSGGLLFLDCNKWPDTKEIPYPPGDEGYTASPYKVVIDERDLEWRGIALFFVAEGNRLNMLDGPTKKVLGSVYFEGAELNPWDINVAVQGDLAIIYMNDSAQLFGFRLPQ